MTPVTSSNISAIGWTRRKLTVQFLSGTSYDYEGVPADVHARFMESNSKGRFFIEHIRDKYPTTKH